MKDSEIVDLYKKTFDPVLQFWWNAKGEIYNIMKTYENHIEIYWVGRIVDFIFPTWWVSAPKAILKVLLIDDFCCRFAYQNGPRVGGAT